MNILQLKYFLRTAELSSVSKVASEAHIFAPAVSNHIKALEEEVGTKLFTRSGGRMFLNKNGEIMYQYVQKIFHALTDAEKEIADLNHSMAYPVKIATLTAPRVIPKLMKAFRAVYPEPYLQINQYQRNSEQIQQEMDIVIYSTEFLVQRENLRCIFEEPIFLAVSKEHPFSHQKEVEISQLQNERFIRRTEYSDFTRYVEGRYFEQMGFEPNTAIITDPAMIGIELVASNMGVCFMPQLTCIDLLDKVSLVRVKGMPMKRYINISWRNWTYQSRAEKLFIDFAADFFANLDLGGTND